MFDIEKMISDHLDGVAREARYSAARALLIGRLAPPFLRAFQRAWMQHEWGNTPTADLYTYTNEAPCVTYSLATHEAYADIRKLTHAMVLDGWKFTVKENADNSRVEYLFRKGDVKGTLFVYTGNSEVCKVVVDKEETVSYVRKTYKLECGPRSTDPTPLELQEPAPAIEHGDVGSAGRDLAPF